MYRKGGDWVMVGEGTAPPTVVTLVDVRSTTLADSYVVRDRTDAISAFTPRGKALEIRPLSDPTALSARDVARFEILYDGKPLAGRTVTMFREAGLHDGRKQVGQVNSDAAGAVMIRPPDAWRYLVLVPSPPYPGYLAREATPATRRRWPLRSDDDIHIRPAGPRAPGIAA